MAERLRMWLSLSLCDKGGGPIFDASQVTASLVQVELQFTTERAIGRGQRALR
jgi:hypothetical protein